MRQHETCQICGYKFPEEYEDDAVVCGACLDHYPQEAVELGDPVAISEHPEIAAVVGKPA